MLRNIPHSSDQRHTHHHQHCPLHTVLPCLDTSCEHMLAWTCLIHQISPCPDKPHTCHNLAADIPKEHKVTKISKYEIRHFRACRINMYLTNATSFPPGRTCSFIINLVFEKQFKNISNQWCCGSL